MWILYQSSDVLILIYIFSMDTVTNRNRKVDLQSFLLWCIQPRCFPPWLEQEDGQYGVLCKMQYGTLFIEFIQSWLSACEYWCLRVSSCVFNIYWNGSLQHVFAYAWMPILSRWSACNSHAENYTRHIGILKCDAQAFYWLKEKINKVWKSPRQKYHYYFYSFNSSRNIPQIIVAFVLYQFSQTVGNSN